MLAEPEESVAVLVGVTIRSVGTVAALVVVGAKFVGGVTDSVSKGVLSAVNTVLSVWKI